jgi:hypothetical protein
MFLAEDVIVGAGARQAQARFVSLLHGDWLAKASENVYGETATGLLRVGPAGGVAASWCGSASWTPSTETTP